MRLSRALSLTFALLLGALALPASAQLQGRLEGPANNGVESGIGLIYGWVCQANQVTVQFNNLAPVQVVYGSERGDTQQTCGDRNNGFEVLANFSIFGPGSHTVIARADGVEIGRATFTVATFGTQFLTGRSGKYQLMHFPNYGQRTTVEWQQGKQNFIVSGVDNTAPLIPGSFFGSTAYTAAGCGAGNDGARQEYAKFTIAVANNGVATITQEFRDGGSCTIAGAGFFFPSENGVIKLPQATFQCGNGRTGNIVIDPITVASSGLSANFVQTFTNPAGCRYTGTLAAARVTP